MNLKETTGAQSGSAQHFYKYMSASTAKIVLRNQTLRWTKPVTLNDPFDMQFSFDHTYDENMVSQMALQKIWNRFSSDDIGGEDHIGKALEVVRRTRGNALAKQVIEGIFAGVIHEGLQNLKRALPDHDQEVNKVVGNTKILSLTTTFDNLLMWSHYADNHRGVVMRFRETDPDSPFRMGKPVNYVGSVPRLLNEDFLSDLLAGKANFDTRAILEVLVYTKGSVWAYENEWRLSLGKGRNPDADFEDLPFGHFELDGVIVGLNASAADRREIVGLVTELYAHAEIFGATRRRDRLHLQLKSHT